MARMMSQQLLGKEIEAVYHTGIVVHGKEYWFGQGLQCAPASHVQTQFGAPLRVEALGTTEVDEEMFRDFLREVQPRYTSETYNLLRHNCNNFTSEAAMFLVGKDIPQQILDLPDVFLSTEIGQALGPMLGMFEQRMRHTSGTSALGECLAPGAVEDAVPKKIAGLPDLGAKPRKQKATANSASASSEDIAKMVRSISQTFGELKDSGASTQQATAAALLAAKDELAAKSEL
jgi:hypothetical protein